MTELNKTCGFQKVKISNEKGYYYIEGFNLDEVFKKYGDIKSKVTMRQIAKDTKTAFHWKYKTGDDWQGFQAEYVLIHFVYN